MKKLNIILCVLLICACFSRQSVSAQSDNPEMDKEAEAAIKGFVKKNNPDSGYAVNTDYQLLSITPNNVDALSRRGYDNLIKDFFNQSRLDYINVIQLDNKNTSAKYYLGVVLSRLGYVDEAEKYFKPTPDYSPGPDYRLTRGKNALLAGNYQVCIESLQGLESVKDFEAAEEKTIFLTIAECYAESGNKLAAKSSFEKAIYFQQGLKNAYSYRLFKDNANGCKYTADKNYQDAVKSFDKSDKGYETFRSLYIALKCDPNHLPSLKMLHTFESKDNNLQGWAKVHQIRIDKLENPNLPPIDVISDREKAEIVESFKKNAPGSLEKGNYDAALNSANEVLRFDPNNVEALVMRARAFYLHSNAALNIIGWRDASKVLQISPNNGLARNIRGLIYLDLKKNTPAAIAEFTKGIESDPKEYRLYLNRGRAYGSLKDFSASIKDLDKVIALDPKNDYAYAIKGFGLYLTKEYQTAIYSLDQAVRINEKNVNARYWLILSHDALGATGNKFAADANHAWMLKNAPNDPRLKQLAGRNPKLNDDTLAKNKRNNFVKEFNSLTKQLEENRSEIEEKLTASNETYKKDYDRKAHLNRSVNYLNNSVKDLKRILLYTEKLYTEEGSGLDSDLKEKAVENIRVIKEEIIKRQKEYDKAVQIYKTLI